MPNAACKEEKRQKPEKSNKKRAHRCAQKPVTLRITGNLVLFTDRRAANCHLLIVMCVVILRMFRMKHRGRYNPVTTLYFTIECCKMQALQLPQRVFIRPEQGGGAA